jgi:hypothetical protein
MPVIHYLLLNSGKARLETLENSQPILSPLKPIKNKVKREVVQFYIARRAAVKNAMANDQEHSNEELVMYNCPWRKAVCRK